ncbi:MAG: hypothetical protein LW870_19870 [Pirellula sp.]|jgi:hypothetical protein|nr:hypothetical protein [Pirellula sp.]
MRLPIYKSLGFSGCVVGSDVAVGHLQPSQVSIPTAIAAKLASDHAISEVTGLAQCVESLQESLTTTNGALRAEAT